MRIAVLVPLIATGLLAGDFGFQRSLPQSNLNNEAGIANRSNVRWTLRQQGFLADDFVVGQAGERWVVDSIRFWAVPGTAESDPASLGDAYDNVRLYFGEESGNLSPVAAISLSPGENGSGNVTAKLARTLPYDDFGMHLRVWEVNFSGLNLVVEGGKRYRAGSFASARDGQHPWFLYASNAALSDSSHDAADGKLFMYDLSGNFAGIFDSAAQGWNKSSDLNLEVSASLLAPAEISGGVLKILSTAGFDATSVDVASLGASAGQLVDVNNDGAADLVVNGSFSGCVKGTLRNGSRFTACPQR